jgi:hypothetical protein
MRADVSYSDEAMLPHGGVKQSGWVRSDLPTLEPRTKKLTLLLGPLQRTMGSGGIPQDQDRHLRRMMTLQYTNLPQYNPSHWKSHRVSHSKSSFVLIRGWLRSSHFHPSSAVCSLKASLPVVPVFGRQETYQVGIPIVPNL